MQQATASRTLTKPNGNGISGKALDACTAGRLKARLWHKVITELNNIANSGKLDLVDVAILRNAIEFIACTESRIGAIIGDMQACRRNCEALLEEGVEKRSKKADLSQGVLGAVCGGDRAFSGRIRPYKACFNDHAGVVYQGEECPLCCVLGEYEERGLDMQAMEQTIGELQEEMAWLKDGKTGGRM